MSAPDVVQLVEACDDSLSVRDLVMIAGAGALGFFAVLSVNVLVGVLWYRREVRKMRGAGSTGIRGALDKAATR